MRNSLGNGAEAAQLMETESDEELRSLAQEEYHTLREQIAGTEEAAENSAAAEGSQ